MPPTICLVLDLDDTLYPERDYVRSGFAAIDSLAEERCGIQAFGDACWESFLNGNRGRIFDAVLQSQCGRVDAEVVSDMVRAYRRHNPAINLHPDARRLLNRASNLALPLALITDGPRESQQAKIDALALRRAFSPIVITDELGPGKSKPHPAAFELVQAALGSSRRFAYIADNPHKDFVAPNQLGWTTIRIQRPGGIYSRATAPTSAHAPRHTVRSLDDIWKLLQ